MKLKIFLLHVNALQMHIFVFGDLIVPSLTSSASMTKGRLTSYTAPYLLLVVYLIHMRFELCNLFQ